MDSIRKFYHDIIKVWANEIKLVFKDKGILIFLFLLPLGYPVVYALIYNPELAREVPVVVVDQCRSTQSRELVRMMDASDNTQLAGYAADMMEARHMVAEKKAYGIVLIDREFSKHIARGEQSHVTLYCDMSLLVRYKAMLTAMTDATMALGSKIQVETVGRMGADGPKIPATIRSTFVALGNPEQGFATFLLPGILTLIVQQSLILAICMMGGAIYERRRRNGGIDPLDTINSGAVSRLIGKSLAYVVVYIIPLLYLLIIMPYVFKYPQVGSFVDILLMSIPYMLSVTFLGMTLQVLVRERESAFLVVVFTSLVFLFLSGITWPLFDMDPFYRFLSGCCPSTWAMQAFERINANGATIADFGMEYQMLWLLTAVYFFLALAVNKYSSYGMLYRQRHSH